MAEVKEASDMPKPDPTKEGGPPLCKFCGEELQESKCSGCGGWTDSYGLFHRKTCSGGFHEECVKKPGEHFH